MVLASNIAFANMEGDAAKLKAEVIEHKNQIVAVHYATEEKGVVDIKITNTDINHIVHVEKEYHHQMAVKKYDLSYLPKGNYTIEITYGKEVVKKNIIL